MVLRGKYLTASLGSAHSVPTVNCPGKVFQSQIHFIYKKMDDNNHQQYVKLISAEGHEFFMDRDVAIRGSKTIRLMLEGNFREAQDNVIRFPDISTDVLERVIKYLHYKAQYVNSSGRIPEFPIEPEVALELLVAAKYLDC